MAEFQFRNLFSLRYHIGTASNRSETITRNVTFYYDPRGTSIARIFCQHENTS